MFNSVVAATRSQLHVDPSLRRIRAQRLKKDHPNSPLDLDVHAVRLCILEYLRRGDHAKAWQQDASRRSVMVDARRELLAAGIKLGGSLRDGQVPRDAFDAALFLDFAGDEFDLWLEVLWEQPRWGRDYIYLVSPEWETYADMTVKDSGLLTPNRVYYDVTDLDREGADELLLWLEDMRKEAAFSFTAERNVGLIDHRPKPRPRGRPQGIPAERPVRGEAMPGYSWADIADQIRGNPARRQLLKQKYVAYWDDQARQGAPKRIGDPTRNFDTQISRHLNS